MSLAAGAPAPAGGLDRVFGSGGIVTTAFSGGSGASARAILLQRDGDIVLAGTSGGDLALARYQADGSLDPSFGDGGTAIADLGTSDEGAAATLEPGGEIVVAGSRGDHAALARFDRDGSLDPSFADSGVAVSPLPGRATAVTATPNGGTLLAAAESGAGPCCSSILARYRADGALDPGFGDGGTVTARLANAASVVRQTGGRIVVAGTQDPANGKNGEGFALAGYRSDGQPDRSFGEAGRVATRLGRDSSATAAALAPDGRIVVVGESDGDLAVARYLPDGELDPSFGKRGEVTVSRPGGDSPSSVAVDRDGTIVVGGTARIPGEGVDRFAVARLDSDGALDPSFGDAGWAISAPGSANALSLAPEHRILVAGSSASANRGRTGFALLRLEGGTTATTAATTAAVQPRTASVIPKRARPRHRHHHRIAPHPVPSWFINANSFRELKRFAATDACTFARNQRRGSRRTLILDFGGARAYGGGAWFGATVNHEGLTASNSQIAAALKVAADAYVSCHRHGRARIVYANTNHFDSRDNARFARRIGVHQSRTSLHLRAYERRHGYDPGARAGVAGDIEMGFWTPHHSKEMVNGAKSVWRSGYVDFGTAGGCPPYPKGVHLHGCFNHWTVKSVGHVSYAGRGHSVPEIYFRGGPSHFDQAAEWAHVARSWNHRHRARYEFFGATASTEFSTLTPGESWKLLRAKAPDPIGRELLNFQQDHPGNTAAR